MAHKLVCIISLIILFSLSALSAEDRISIELGRKINIFNSHEDTKYILISEWQEGRIVPKATIRGKALSEDTFLIEACLLDLEHVPTGELTYHLRKCNIIGPKEGFSISQLVLEMPGLLKYLSTNHSKLGKFSSYIAKGVSIILFMAAIIIIFAAFSSPPTSLLLLLLVPIPLLFSSHFAERNLLLDNPFKDSYELIEQAKSWSKHDDLFLSVEDFDEKEFIFVVDHFNLALKEYSKDKSKLDQNIQQQ